jgi:anti-sigma B factor antagonist
MAFQITERSVDGIVVLDLDGRLTISDGAERLKDKVNSLVVQARARILLNLANVTYIDSGGLGQLAASYATVAKSGGDIKLVNLGKRHHDLLSMTRLLTLFDTFENEAEAVQKLQQTAGA